MMGFTPDIRDSDRPIEWQGVHSIFWQSWLHRTPLRLLVAGEFAVAIFFTLSSYVLLVRFFRARQQSQLIYSGMIRRWPRLLIPTAMAALIYYSWLHFGPFPGASNCHEIGDLGKIYHCLALSY